MAPILEIQGTMGTGPEPRNDGNLLTPEDLADVDHDLSALRRKLKEKYGLSEEEAAIEAQRFADAFDVSRAMREGDWKDPGKPKIREKDHPESDVIRKSKDNGVYIKDASERTI